jgi:hypothetical protein
MSKADIDARTRCRIVLKIMTERAEDLHIRMCVPSFVHLRQPEPWLGRVIVAFFFQPFQTNSPHSLRSTFLFPLTNHTKITKQQRTYYDCFF